MKKLLPVVICLTLVLAFFAVIDPSGGTVNLSDKDNITAINEMEPEPVKDADLQANGKDSKDKPSLPPSRGTSKKGSKANNNQPTTKGYFIDVNIGEQKVRIYNNGTVIKEWIVSTGKNDSTPLGNFTIQNRGEWFFSEKYQQGAKWWVSFKDWGVYLFHSVPMDRDKNVLEEEADKLGNPASHGCIRLEIDHSKWIYDNIPAGTPVSIHK
ncbi:MAG: L,D-transpeptidase [Syntrophomonadales bacterium]